MHFTDSHAHVTADSVYENLDEILKSAAQEHVRYSDQCMHG